MGDGRNSQSLGMTVKNTVVNLGDDADLGGLAAAQVGTRSARFILLAHSMDTDDVVPRTVGTLASSWSQTLSARASASQRPGHQHDRSTSCWCWLPFIFG